MPFTFPVAVLLFTTDVEGLAKQLDLPITASDGGVSIGGRDSQGDDLTRLILTEALVDEVVSVIPNFSSLTVPTATAKGNLTELKVPAEPKAGEMKHTANSTFDA